MQFVNNLFAYKYDSAVLDSTIGSEQASIFYSIDLKALAGTIVVLFFVNNQSNIVCLILKLIQILIQFLNGVSVFYAVWSSS